MHTNNRGQSDIVIHQTNIRNKSVFEKKEALVKQDSLPQSGPKSFMTLFTGRSSDAGMTSLVYRPLSKSRQLVIQVEKL
jgi:hypothetical protein